MLMRLAFALGFLATAAGVADAQIALTGGQRARYVDALTRPDSATVRFSRDPALLSLVSPLCPQSSTLRFSSSNHVNPAVTLDCTKWKLSGSAFVYSNTKAGPGSVRSIRYRLGTLSITVNGPGYTPPIAAPVTWVETRFTVGSTEYCGRFDNIIKNQAATSSRPGLIIAKGPSVPCQVVCGDGIREGGELCDDGNHTNGDGCDNNCTPTGCGNGVVTPNTGEQCDGGPGCRANCTLIRCGDGILDPGEQCDDGNNQNGDCCSSTCHFEASGSACADDGNVCTNDVCNGAGVCTHPNNTAACDDHNVCTSNDHCTGGVCVGTPIPPWVNEFDYDDNAQGLTADSDEFIEIAGPAGTDLGGYQVSSVIGSNSLACNSPNVVPGNAYFTSVIPNGTVLGNDNGRGVGFFTVCFTGSSMDHVVAGECDVILPAPSNDNLPNGDPLNLGTSCPDGILLLDDLGNLVDAISYEGVVPNTGAYGHFFNAPNPSYNAGTDQGLKVGVSFEKSTSTLHRATAASEWHLSGGCTTAGALDTGCVQNSDSPGRENAGQTLTCTVGYGSPARAFLDAPGSLLE
jgi:cysteine-rich repeat protein